MIAGPLFDQAAEARDPGFSIESAGRQHLIGETGAPQDLDLRAVELFAPKVRRIDLVGIDERDANAGARQHGRRGGTSQSAARYDDIGVPHPTPHTFLGRLLCDRMLKET